MAVFKCCRETPAGCETQSNETSFGRRSCPLGAHFSVGDGAHSAASPRCGEAAPQSSATSSARDGPRIIVVYESGHRPLNSREAARTDGVDERSTGSKPSLVNHSSAVSVRRTIASTSAVGFRFLADPYQRAGSKTVVDHLLSDGRGLRTVRMLTANGARRSCCQGLHTEPARSTTSIRAEPTGSAKSSSPSSAKQVSPTVSRTTVSVPSASR